jgi:hypothetical protein
VRVALETLAFVAGLVIVVGTLVSAVRSTILPRGVQSWVSRGPTQAVRAAFRLWVGRSASYERRDRTMAMLGPIALLALLATWLILIMAGYTLMYLAVTSRSLTQSVELSGSSVFTLGTTTERTLGPLLLTYTEAGLGLLLVALLITYLPTIYGAFARREKGVAQFQVRGGNPPTAATMLIRYHRIEQSRYRLTELWREWMDWFADVEETHTTFPIVTLFRSSHPERSWIASAGALLDGASFWAGAVEHPKDPDVQLCIRAGYLALRRIADIFKLPYDPDPGIDDPISISREEWDEAMDEMAAAGVPLIADRNAAWAAWKGWRVNYDSVLLNLARLVEAPPTPWVSDRSPVYVTGSQGSWLRLGAAESSVRPLRSLRERWTDRGRSRGWPAWLRPASRRPPG